MQIELFPSPKLGLSLKLGRAKAKYLKAGKFPSPNLGLSLK